MFASAKDIRRDVANLVKAPRRMKVSEAVAEYMRVPVGGGNSIKWDKNTAPYIIDPMDCLNSREYDAVIFVGPARTGKTVGLIDGWITYSIICDPSDFLLVQLTQEKASEHSRKRLDRTFRCSPEVSKRLSPRKNDNNVHDKYFRAGNLLKIGWPSINVLSSSDYKYVALTDYDRWPDDVDGEGDGFSLASKRTTTFMSAGMTLVESSPGKDIVDIKYHPKSTHEAPPTTGILSLYNRGDRRRFYWQCPTCSEWFEPSMANMVGYRDDTDYVKASEKARLQCPHCQTLIEPDRKRALNIGGKWLKEGQTIDKSGVIHGEGRNSRIASFWLEGIHHAPHLSNADLTSLWNGAKKPKKERYLMGAVFCWPQSMCRVGGTVALSSKLWATVKTANDGLLIDTTSNHQCEPMLTASVILLTRPPTLRTGICLLAMCSISNIALRG